MKILITGGSGFIGRHIIKRLSNDGHDIYNIDKNINPSLDINKQKIIDLYDLNINDDFFNGIECIIHLAAMVSVPRSFSDPVKSFGDNVFLTVKLLSAAHLHNIKKFVFASSAAVYGDKEGQVSEVDDANPNSPYGLDKLSCEKYIQMFSNIWNTEYLILRFFNVYGEGQNPEYAGVITAFTNAVKSNQPLTIYGDGEQSRDFINVTVLTDYISKLLNKNISNQVINLGSGQSVSINQIAKQFSNNIIYKEPRKEVKHSCANITKLQSLI